MWMGVSTLHASNIKGFAFQFARTRPVWIGPWCSVACLNTPTTNWLFMANWETNCKLYPGISPKTATNWEFVAARTQIQWLKRGKELTQNWLRKLSLSLGGTSMLCNVNQGSCRHTLHKKADAHLGVWQKSISRSMLCVRHLFTSSEVIWVSCTLICRVQKSSHKSCAHLIRLTSLTSPVCKPCGKATHLC